jgi:hypothetical protein
MDRLAVWSCGMLPDFTDRGLLPEGVHPVTFDEFKKRFVYFGRTDQRYRLFNKLRELYLHASRSGIVKRFLVGGSFVTSEPEPNDFDCILVLDPGIYGHEMRPMEYNLVSRRRARRIYGGDVISVADGSIDYHEFLDFFQNTRNQDRVGIVEIRL